MARIIVDHENAREVVASLSAFESGVIAFDTETYGLKWHDKSFALQLAIRGGDSFYFNFHQYPEEQNAPVLPRTMFKMLDKLWFNSNIRWIAANAKFDMRRLDIEGVHLTGEIYDILLMERIRYNRHISYSLDSCLKRIGLAKNDEVSQWISEHKAYTTYAVEGKKTKEKDLHYDRVPFDIMVRYGFDDAEGTLLVYEDQQQYFTLPENKEQINLVHSNIELTKTVFAMEKRGVVLDLDYCKYRQTIEGELVTEKADRIEQMTQQKFKAGPKWLTEVLNAQGVALEISDKGNPVLDKNALKAIPNAVAHYVLEMREHEKRHNGYNTLIRFCDSTGVLHTNYRINGTDTLRFSSSDPNLQNIEACEKGNPYTQRTSFKPREGFFFLAIDYKAMEYRLVADIAGEMGWIEAIMNGADPHQWVADLMGSDRKAAKTLNFMLLYGGGLAKLAMSLFPMKHDQEILQALCKAHIYGGGGRYMTAVDHETLKRVTPEYVDHDIEFLKQSDKLKKIYFEALPAIGRFSKDVMDVGKSRGFVRNQYGMRYHIDKPEFAYKLPNHLIQGTGACVIRSAMNKLAYQLDGMRSAMLLQVHDELIFEIHKDEYKIGHDLKRIMESEYKPRNGMLLECDAEYSYDSWNSNTFKPWDEYDHKGKASTDMAWSE